MDDRPAPAPRSLYVHVPFCRRRCSYCDAYHEGDPAEETVRRYITTLRQEALRDLPPGEHYETIYVGGGTPTELPAWALGSLLELLASRAAPGAEFTVEANPASCGSGVLQAFRQAGVNRVSVGAQSFDPVLLDRLGRRHEPDQVTGTVQGLRGAGVSTVSLDLIHGIPLQGLASVEADLEAALALRPEHLSVYCLILEANTLLARQVAAGQLPPPTEEALADQLQLVRHHLTREGLPPYEISSFAPPGQECRHNLVCWAYGRYRALGPGASSFVGWRRRTRARNVQRWLESQGRASDEDEHIDTETAVQEVLMLGLRLQAGLTREQLLLRAGAGLSAEQERTVRTLADRGLLEDDGERLRLTETGVLLANQVILALW